MGQVLVKLLLHLAVGILQFYPRHCQVHDHRAASILVGAVSLCEAAASAAAHGLV